MNVLFLWKGSIGRGPYALAGAILFFVKWNLDRFLGAEFFNDPWPIRYIFPHENFLGLDADGRKVVTLLAATSLPFIYVGLVLTLKRLPQVQLKRMAPWSCDLSR